MSRQQPSQDFGTQPSPPNPSRKRPVSERKIQANRRNALRSTGPRTERGKRTVSQNAIKHGLLAREVVITAGNGKESAAEFYILLGSFCDCYEPIGIVEESLVQTIAACWWRKARVIRAENGEIRKRLDTVAVDSAFQNLDKASLDLVSSEVDLDMYRPGNQADQQVSTRQRLSAMQSNQRALREHHAGLAYLRELLMTAKSEMFTDGYISEKILNRIIVAFSLWDCPLALTCVDAGPPEARKEDPMSKGFVDQSLDKQRAAVIALIETRLKAITVLGDYAKERESLTLDSEARSFCLPPQEATDKLLRYEAHLDRQLYRAMDQLERMQRQRRGEKVPPPLNVNLGRRN